LSAIFIFLGFELLWILKLLHEWLTVSETVSLSHIPVGLLLIMRVVPD